MKESVEKTGVKLFFVETYGCQMNIYDSELVASILENAGYSAAPDLESADIVLVNTCAVRQHAETRVRGRINVLKAWKYRKPGRKICVLGCVAQAAAPAIAKDSPFVDVIAGPDSYRELPALLEAGSEIPLMHTILDTAETYSGIIPSRSGSVSGWVAITRGCNNFCSYCIVPYTRGRERSRSAPEIIQELNMLARSGVSEVTLLGQNVNSYTDETTDFASLLEQAAAVPGLYRLRFLTSHPKDISEKLLEVMTSHSNICRHLHLPLQSGSNAVLKAMNRGYTVEHYCKSIEYARRIMPDISLSTDMIVGFPGETEKDFSETLTTMETVQYDDAFTYRYSKRSGTKAASMPGQVPEPVIMERLNRLIVMQRAISLKSREKMIGRCVEVLPEAVSKQSDQEWIGKTQGNFAVVFPKQGLCMGKPVRLQINELRGVTLRGVPMQQEEPVMG